MAVEFDPYHKWLGIPPAEQPANFYRLLALNPFESDPDVIEAAADARIAHLRSLQTGKFGDLTQPLLNEVTSARLCLLKPERKATYDASLRAQLAARYASPPPPEPVASPEPVQASASAETPAVAQSGPELLDFISADGPGGSCVDAADWSGMTGSTAARSMSGSALVRSKKNAWPQMFMIFGPVLGIVAVAIAIMIRNGQDTDNSTTATSASSSRGDTTEYASSSRPAILPQGRNGDMGFSSLPSRGVNQPAAYLDDLRERDVKIGFGSLGKHGATGYPPEEMQRVQTDGRYVAHALSMHPRTNGSAQVSYALGGKYQSFSAVAALMSSSPGEPPPATPLLFRVLGDAKILWSSPKPLQSPGERDAMHGVGAWRDAADVGSDLPWPLVTRPRRVDRSVGINSSSLATPASWWARRGWAKTESAFRFIRRSRGDAAGLLAAGQAAARWPHDSGFREAAGARSGETGGRYAHARAQCRRSAEGAG